MKLLSSFETRDKREQLNTALSSRSAGLDEAIVAKRKELLTMDEEFLRAIEHNRLTRMSEEAEWEQRNQALRAETEGLERRKAIALVPLEEREKAIENTREALLQRESNVSKREEEAEKNLELLEMRLDDASDRLANAQKRAQELSRREEGVKMQEAQTKARASEFNALLTDTLLNFDKQRLEIATKLRELEGKETVLRELEARISFAEKDLVSRETRLADRYATLERATKEVQNKHASTPRRK